MAQSPLPYVKSLTLINILSQLAGPVFSGFLLMSLHFGSTKTCRSNFFLHWNTEKIHLNVFNRNVTAPSMKPTVAPYFNGTSKPTTYPPTATPTYAITTISTNRTYDSSAFPSFNPSLSPILSTLPTIYPTAAVSIPTKSPSSIPTYLYPSCQPSSQPSSQPTNSPSRQPSSFPSVIPTCSPTRQPSFQPSRQPNSRPSNCPSSNPSSKPTVQPSSSPTLQPSTQPTRQPSSQPSSRPSVKNKTPTRNPTIIPTTPSPSTVTPSIGALSQNITANSSSVFQPTCTATEFGIAILSIHFGFDVLFVFVYGFYMWVCISKKSESDPLMKMIIPYEAFFYIVLFFIVIGGSIGSIVIGNLVLATQPGFEISDDQTRVSVGACLIALFLFIGPILGMLSYLVYIYIFFVIEIIYLLLYYSELYDLNNPWNKIILFVNTKEWVNDDNIKIPAYEISVCNLVFENLVEAFIVIMLFYSEFTSLYSVLFSLPMIINVIYRCAILLVKLIPESFRCIIWSIWFIIITICNWIVELFTGRSDTATIVPSNNDLEIMGSTVNESATSGSKFIVGDGYSNKGSFFHDDGNRIKSNS
eukprot:gene4273-6052_t